MQFHKPQFAKLMKVVLNDLDIAQRIIELKYDGHRRLVSAERSWSRDGLEHQHPWLQQYLPKGVLLDGELVLRDQASHSSKVTHALCEHPEGLEFVAFDILYHQGQSTMKMPLHLRKKLLLQVMSYVQQDFDGDRHPAVMQCPMSLSKTFHVQTSAAFMELFAEVTTQGQEGLILKRVDAPYRPGSRSMDWFKMKHAVTVDVVITDCESKPSEWRVRPGEVGADGILYPEGRHTDPWLAGDVGLSYGWWDARKGCAVRVGSLGYTGTREALMAHVGQVAEVRVNGVFETGAMQHPVLLRWRTDKRPEECVFDFEAGKIVE